MDFYEQLIDSIDKEISLLKDVAIQAKERFEEAMRRCLKFAKNPFTDKPFSSMDQQSSTEPQTVQNTLVTFYYKVIKKPPAWNKPCYFVGQIGECRRTDHTRGAQLKFPGGEAVYIPFECLEKAQDPRVTAPITQETAKAFAWYKFIKAPKDIIKEDAEKLVGQIGQCKWVNPWGIGMKLNDGQRVTVQWECLQPVESTDHFGQVTADNIVTGREYTVISLPKEYKPTPSGGLMKYIGRRGVCEGSHYRAGARLSFDSKSKDTILLPFECLRDDPKPTDADLHKAILQNPEKVLRIIKRMGQLTNLPPVQDFLEKGLLPDLKMLPILKPSIQATTEQHSMALVLVKPSLKMTPIIDLANPTIGRSVEAPKPLSTTDEVIDIEVIGVEREPKSINELNPNKDELGRQLIQID